MDLNKRLLEWEYFYNRQRPHASLKGKTPYETYLEVENLIPTQPEVTQAYWDSPFEQIVPRNNKHLLWIKEQRMSHIY